MSESFHDLVMGIQPIDLFSFKEAVPELLPLEKCEQSPKWHGEGNVLIHSNMAGKIAQAELSLQTSLPYDYKVNIYLATLLHDIGKPEASFVKEGKIVAYDHGKMGVYKAREFLRKYFPEFNFARREWICNLIEFHMSPRELVKSLANDSRYKRYSLDSSTLESYLLSRADLQGRIAQDVPSIVAELEVYKARCEALGIWDQPYTIPGTEGMSQFGYNLARWKVLFNGMDDTNTEAIKGCESLMSKPPFELLLMVGAPGSGKTTYRTKNFPGVATICLDEYRARILGDMNDMSKNDMIFNTASADLRTNMKARINTIWDATSYNRKSRRRIIDIARRHGATIGIVYFDLPEAVLQARNASRERVVPAEIVSRFYRNLESPKPYEYDQLIVISQ